MDTDQLIGSVAQSEMIRTKLHNILAAYQKMDYHLLDIELDDDRLYEDMRKTSFKIAFTKRKKTTIYLLRQYSCPFQCFCFKLKEIN